jgi:hypothetical protein
MSADHLAKEAARLRADEIFNKALDDIRSEALEALAVAAVESPMTILRWQSRVMVVDEIRNALDRYILAADVQEQPGSFA